MPPNNKADDSTRMPPPPGGTTSGRPLNTRNITDTEGWKSSRKGVKRVWGNYKKLLTESFNNMSRSEQEDLIDKFALIFTIGVTCLVVLLFSPVMPRLVRVLGVPAALIAAWWAGRRIVGPVIIDRMSHLLKREEREDLVETPREDR
jgi:hypothetical protein